MYRNIKQYPDSEVYPGVLAFRIGEDGSPAPSPACRPFITPFWPHPLYSQCMSHTTDAPVYFANVNTLEDKIDKAVIKATAWSEIQGVPRLIFLILDLTPVHHVDSMVGGSSTLPSPPSFCLGSIRLRLHCRASTFWRTSSSPPRPMVYNSCWPTPTATSPETGRP